MQSRAVLFDAMGVLLDLDEVGRQWIPLLGEVLPARLGGTAGDWARANAAAFARWNARIAEASRKAGPRKGSRDSHVNARTAWLVDMCEQVGVAAPGDAERVAAEIHRACATRVRAPLGDAVQAVRALHAGGYTLFTASSLPSWEIEAYLEALGIRDLFERAYGCDLVDRWKTGPHYYRAICEDTGIDPRRAVTVDDNAVVLDWAAKLRMRTFLLGGQGGGQRHERIASLLELTALI